MDLLSLALVAILAVFVAAVIFVLVVLIGAWRRPAEGEDCHLAAFLGGQAGGLVCFR